MNYTIFLLFCITISSDKATSIINKPQTKKRKYYNNKHDKLKAKQICTSWIECNDTITTKPFTSKVICIESTLNTHQLLLKAPIDNFGAITADIIDGSYSENIFIPPNSAKYLTKYYGFDNYYYPNISIPLRIIPPAINISHEITIECMICDQNICGQTVISDHGEMQRFCVQTHINSDNPSYVSQFVFVCHIGQCFVQVYDYMNQLQFSTNIVADAMDNNNKIQFSDFNIGETYTIEFTGADSNISKLAIDCYDPLFHSANFEKNKNNNTQQIQNAQRFTVLLSMVAITSAVTLFYILKKCHTTPPQTVWDDR